MLVARVTFRLEGEGRSRLVERAYDLLSCWYKNGQVVSDGWPVVERGGSVEAMLRIPEADSLDAAHHNLYVRQVLAELLPMVPEVEVIGVEPASRMACQCASRSALTFFTSYLSLDPPVRCLDCFGFVPLYELPYVHDHEHLILLQWAADYRACDTLQMHCTTGERFGERQLAEHDSSLSKNGRRLAADVERLSGTPVYYYLHKMRSRGLPSELARKCPSCNAPWRLEQSVHGFDFQCRPCRLLSSVASDAS